MSFASAHCSSDSRYPLGNTLLLRSEAVAVHIIFHPHKIARLTQLVDGSDTFELVDIGPKSVFEVRATIYKRTACKCVRRLAAAIVSTILSYTEPPP